MHLAFTIISNDEVVDLEDPLALRSVVAYQLSADVLGLLDYFLFICSVFRPQPVQADNRRNVQLEALWRAQVDRAHTSLDIYHVIQVHAQQIHRRLEANLANHLALRNLTNAKALDVLQIRVAHLSELVYRRGCDQLRVGQQRSVRVYLCLHLRLNKGVLTYFVIVF